MPFTSLKHSAFYLSQWLLALVMTTFVTASLADDYADISQLLKLGKSAEAQTLVDAKLAVKPADPQLRFLKGVTLRQLGEQALAIDTFTQLTQDYPELPEPYNNLAVLYAAQGQYDRARVTLEMAIRAKPDYATAYENMGDVYARLANQAYNKALLIDGGNTAVVNKLSMIRELFKADPAGHAAAPTLPASAAEH
jgi:Flp pilus assembly protein TadD